MVDTGDLVSQNHGQRTREVSIDHVQIAMTDAAGSDGERGTTRVGPGLRVVLDQPQVGTHPIANHSAHQ